MGWQDAFHQGDQEQVSKHGYLVKLTIGTLTHETYQLQRSFSLTWHYKSSMLAIGFMQNDQTNSRNSSKTSFPNRLFQASNAPEPIYYSTNFSDGTVAHEAEVRL